MTLMMRLVTAISGRAVGKDGLGNVYYEGRKVRPSGRLSRWVMYAGAAEASSIPPEWHSWLHYTTDAPLPQTVRKRWQKPHEPNLTGTPQGYRPPGSDYLGGNRPHATGDYESWTPGS